MSTVEQTEQWLECHIDKGMFSDERAVSYPPTGQYRKSVFVPAGAVQGTLGEKGCRLYVSPDQFGTAFAP